MSIFLGIQHTAFDESRKVALPDLVLGCDGDLYVECDHTREGVWPPWRRLAERGLASGASHIVTLNDDVIPCEDFRKVLAKVIEARSEDVIGLFANHPRAKDAYGSILHPPQPRHHWMTTSDGLAGVGMVLPRNILEGFLDFVDHDLLHPWGLDTEDRTLNLYCMALGRRIWHTLPSLVEHGEPERSLCGTAAGNARSAVVPPEPGMLGIDWTCEDASAPHLGRLYQGNHWRLLTCIKPTSWRKYSAVERAYELAREPWGGKTKHQGTRITLFEDTPEAE